MEKLTTSEAASYYGVPELPVKHLRQIGRITVNFAVLEANISHSVWNLISDEDQILGRVITAELSFRNRVALFSSLIRHHSEVLESLPPDAVKELEALLARALLLEEKRNIVTHSIWLPTKSMDTILRFKTTAKISKGLRSQFELTSVADLKKIADDISVLARQIMGFMSTLEPDSNEVILEPSAGQ